MRVSILLIAIVAILPCVLASIHSHEAKPAHHKPHFAGVTHHGAKAAAEAALADRLGMHGGRPHPKSRMGHHGVKAHKQVKEVDYKAMFEAFKAEYNRVYTADAEESLRFDIFVANMKHADELNIKNPSATFGVTRFSDLHPEEFKKQYLNFKPDTASVDAGARHAPHHTHTSLPTAFDWRKPDQNRPVAVTAVKDQGQCGSCWAFSATETLESSWILSGHPSVNLAPQQTVDCDTVDGACQGGDTVSAYTYMEANGVEAEASYPYWSGLTGVNGTCKYNPSKVVARMKSFIWATPNCAVVNDTCSTQNEAQLQQTLYNVGPVSICVDADNSWQSYIGGILTPAGGCSSAYNDVDHCVQLTGWGVDPSTNQKYWSVRNSWNTYWGENGYIRLSFGQNTCGVADYATIPQTA